MKARIKKTGRIVDLSDFEYDVYDNEYLRTELEIIDDYWDKLKHQAAISAMQGLLTNPKLCEIETSISLAITATTIASALIDKLKEEEK